MKYAALLLAVLGCGRYGFSDRADATIDSGSAAGTRLKLMWNVYEGGLRQPTGMLFDTVLQTTCYPSDTTSGIRCLVANAAISQYLDSACTEPASPKASPDQQYAFDTVYPPATHAYTFGASVGIPSAVYGRNFDGSCSAGSAPTTEWFALDEIPFDRFALLTDEQGSEGRLVSQALVTDDGLRVPGGLHDTAVDEDCIGDVFDDGTYCFPFDTDLVQYYADNACTQPLEEAYTPTKFAAYAPTLPACTTSSLQVLPLTTLLSNTTPIWLEITGSGSCVQTTAVSGYKLYKLGAPITLAAVTRQPRAGARIQAIEDSANGAIADETLSVWDSQLGIECKPATAADGMVRCLPTNLYGASAGYYTDAGCTQAVTAVGVLGPTCAAFSMPYVADYNAGGPGPRIFRATRVTGMTHQGGASNCSAQPNVDMYVETGAEVPPATFALVTQATDP